MKAEFGYKNLQPFASGYGGVEKDLKAVGIVSGWHILVFLFGCKNLVDAAQWEKFVCRFEWRVVDRYVSCVWAARLRNSLSWSP